MILRSILTTTLALLFAATLTATSTIGINVQESETTSLLRQPTVSANHVVFVYAGDLWRVDRDGLNPLRLTSAQAEENNPFFSPDGSKIAYSAEYEGNTDVYVISVDGGTPERLTWHPGADIVSSWSSDGEAVAFFSRRETDNGRSGHLYHVSVAGGAPEKQMEARYFRGQWNEDGTNLAYIDFGPGYNSLYGGTAGWRGYRGGSTPSVKIFNPAENSLQHIPGERINDIQPFWLGNHIYFISDRHEARLNMHRFDPETEAIERLTDQNDWDILWAAGHGNSVIYAAGGDLYDLNVTTGEAQKIIYPHQSGSSSITSRMEKCELQYSNRNSFA